MPARGTAPEDTPPCPACGASVLPAGPWSDAPTGPPAPASGSRGSEPDPWTAPDPWAARTPGAAPSDDARSDASDGRWSDHAESDRGGSDAWDAERGAPSNWAASGVPAGHEGPFGAEKAPPAPRERTRFAIWPLLVLLVGLFVHFDGTFVRPAGPALEAAGQLHGAVLAELSGEGWRLVHASFLHKSSMILLITLFLVGWAGGEVERRAGAGLLLFLFVGGGALLNALRVTVEPGRSLELLAGGWPAGFALGGAALVLVHRLGTDGSGRVLAILFLELVLLGYTAHTDALLDGRLALVVCASFALGLVVGALWPLGAWRAPAGVAAAALTAAAIGLGEQGRRHEATRAPWELTPSRRALPELEAVPLEELGLVLDLPRGWRQLPRQGERQVLFEEHTVLGARRRLGVQSVRRGPYDAADTLAIRTLAELTRPGSWLRDPIYLEEGPLESAGLGRGYMVALQGTTGGGGAQASEQVMLRLYYFVGERLTVRVDGIAIGGGDPAAAQADGELFDAVLRSLRLHPRARGDATTKPGDDAGPQPDLDADPDADPDAGPDAGRGPR